jgi:hypothetical protein
MDRHPAGRPTRMTDSVPVHALKVEALKTDVEQINSPTR